MDIGKIPRGEDFAHKFARGEWAETVLLEVIEQENGISGFQYGVSRGDALDTKTELDEVKEPGVEEMKRPDILVFEEEQLDELDETTQELIHDYISAEPDKKAEILPQLEQTNAPSAAAMALEAESSKFHIGKRGYNSSLSAYVKDEDYPRLMSWRNQYQVPIFVCQLFFDRAYIIPFAAYEKYGDEARNGSATVPGFKHDTIPVIRKDGLQAKVETFPHSKLLGVFSENPSVVRHTNDGIEETNFDWSDSGQLDAVDSAFFSDGTLSLEQPFTDYL